MTSYRIANTSAYAPDGLEGLVGELVTLGCAAELGQAIGDRWRGVEGGHHSDRRLASVQLHGEARLVGIAQPQVLLVKRAHRHAAQDRRAEERSSENPDHAADRGALTDAVGAHLVPRHTARIAQ